MALTYTKCQNLRAGPSELRRWVKVEVAVLDSRP